MFVWNHLSASAFQPTQAHSIYLKPQSGLSVPFPSLDPSIQVNSVSNLNSGEYTWMGSAPEHSA